MTLTPQRETATVDREIGRIHFLNPACYHLADQGWETRPGADVGSGGEICGSHQSRSSNLADGYSTSFPMAEWQV